MGSSGYIKLVDLFLPPALSVRHALLFVAARVGAEQGPRLRGFAVDYWALGVLVYDMNNGWLSISQNKKWKYTFSSLFYFIHPLTVVVLNWQIRTRWTSPTRSPTEHHLRDNELELNCCWECVWFLCVMFQWTNSFGLWWRCVKLVFR